MKQNWTKIALAATWLMAGMGNGVWAKPIAGSEMAESAVSPVATPFVSSVKFNGFVQTWSSASDAVYDLKVAHARLRVTALVDEETTLAIMPEFAPGGFVLLDAYAQRALGEGWSVMAGQFKPAFGDDRYLTPAQLKRVNYTKMDSFAFPGNTNAWDIGMEIKKVSEQVTFQADLVQGAGPNKSADNDKTKDLAGRVEWKDAGFALGCSYYGGTNNGAGYLTYQNWGGFHVRYSKDGLDARAEAILAPFDRNAYFGQLAYKTGRFEPLAWYEAGFVGSVQNYQVLGGGLSYWPSPKTRLTLNGILNGVTDFSGPSVAILQAEQLF